MLVLIKISHPYLTLQYKFSREVFKQKGGGSVIHGQAHVQIFSSVCQNQSQTYCHKLWHCFDKVTMIGYCLSSESDSHNDVRITRIHESQGEALTKNWWLGGFASLTSFFSGGANIHISWWGRNILGGTKKNENSVHEKPMTYAKFCQTFFYAKIWYNFNTFEIFFKGGVNCSRDTVTALFQLAWPRRFPVFYLFVAMIHLSPPISSSFTNWITPFLTKFCWNC